MTAAAAPAPNTRCPRCGGDFRCGARDPGRCACDELVLPPALLAALRRQFDGCLCTRCLQALAASSRHPVA